MAELQPFNNIHDTKINSHCYSRIPFGADMVLLRQGINRLFVLNDTATFIWDEFLAGRSVHQIKDQLVEQYGIDRNTATADIETIVLQWKQDGLIGLMPDEKCKDYSGFYNQRFMASALQSDHIGDYRLGCFEFRICSDDVELKTHPEALLMHLRTDDAGAADPTKLDIVKNKAGYSLYQDGFKLADVGGIDHLICTLPYELAQIAATRLDWSVVLHGAAVSHGEACIVLPAPGGSGKTTLTAALVHGGLNYLSDDIVPVDKATSRAMPLPIPLAIKPGSWPVLEPYYPGLCDQSSYQRGDIQIRYLIPPRTESNPLPIRYLVFPSFRCGARAQLDPITGSQALRRLMDAEPLIRTPLNAEYAGNFIAWLEAIPAFECTYDSLDDAVKLIRPLLV